MEAYLTIEELACLLKVAEQTIRRWVLNREIPFYKVRKVIRFRPSEIEMWVCNGGSVSGISKPKGGLLCENETAAAGEPNETARQE